MRLLQLSPEVVRLRRVAKACCAGELSRTEYRQARREVIDKFVQSVSHDSEDTVPRYDPDVTQRRAPVMAQSAQVVQRPVWPLWTLLLALLVAALLAPLWSFAAEVIPPLAERDPNPATSPRYAVTGLQWQAPAALEDTVVASAQSYLIEQLALAKKQCWKRTWLHNHE